MLLSPPSCPHPCTSDRHTVCNSTVLGPIPFLPLTLSPYPFKSRGRGKGKGVRGRNGIGPHSSSMSLAHCLFLNSRFYDFFADFSNVHICYRYSFSLPFCISLIVSLIISLTLSLFLLLCFSLTLSLSLCFCRPIKFKSNPLHSTIKGEKNKTYFLFIKKMLK